MFPVDCLQMPWQQHRYHHCIGPKGMVLVVFGILVLCAVGASARADTKAPNGGALQSSSLPFRLHIDGFMDPLTLRDGATILRPRLEAVMDRYLLVSTPSSAPAQAAGMRCSVVVGDGPGGGDWLQDFIVAALLCSGPQSVTGASMTKTMETLIEHLDDVLGGDVERVCVPSSQTPPFDVEGRGGAGIPQPIMCFGVMRVVLDAKVVNSRGGTGFEPLREGAAAARTGNATSGHQPSGRRRLFQRDDEEDGAASRRVYPADAYDVETLWGIYPDAMGQNVRLGLFDTGVSVNNPHLASAQIAACMSFTDERGGGESSRWCADGHGHGSFGASLMVGGGGVADGAGGCRATRDETLPPPGRRRVTTGGVGLAPKAALYVFKVFTDEQLSVTSWFLAAFNVALQLQLDVINLSFGSMDYYDDVFLEKIRDVAAAGIVVVTASGNDGPRHGSVFNPADQAEVFAVGSVDGPVPRRVSPFSSRGMTTWELPFGMGRPRPDVVSFGEDVVGGSSQRARRTCRVLTGTSVASPVVAGVLGMLVSFIKGTLLDAEQHRRVSGIVPTPSPEQRALVTNVAMLKQIIMETARPLCPPLPRSQRRPSSSAGSASVATLRDYSLFSQGAGLVDPHRALAWVARRLSPGGEGFGSFFRLTAYPPKILARWADQTLREVRDNADCSSTLPYAWPWVLRANGGGVFLTSSAMVVNLTLYNSGAATSHLVSATVVYDNATIGATDFETPRSSSVTLSSASAKRLLTVDVDATPTMRAHVGFAGVFFSTTVPLPAGVRRATVYGTLRLQYRSSRGSGRNPSTARADHHQQQLVDVPFAIDVTRPPPRRRRLLWDVTAQLLYPGSFVPRDNIRQQGSLDFAEWGGDHPLTNYAPLYEFLVVELGYVVDLIHHPKMLEQPASSAGGATQPLGHVATVSVLSLYQILLVVDPEDYMDRGYMDRIEDAVKVGGLRLVVLSDWAHEGVMLHASFTDPATQLFWEPITGGVTVAAVNALMRRFGIVQSDHCVVSGHITTADASVGGLMVPLTSAGCLYSVANDEGVRLILPNGSLQEVWSCHTAGTQPLHDDALELQELASWRQGQEQQQSRAAPMVGSKRRRQRPPAGVMFPASDAPPLFAFVRYSTTNAPVGGAAVQKGRNRQHIDVVGDHQQAIADEPLGPLEAASLDGSGRGGGGGVFFFPDSDCVDAMHHYGSSGLPSPDHTYCFGFLASALKVLNGDETLDGDAESLPDVPSPRRRSPLASVCRSIPVGARVQWGEVGIGMRAAPSPPNRTWEDESAIPATSRRRDPLYLVSRRYRALVEHDDACRSQRLDRPTGGRPPLRCARERWAIEDRIGEMLDPWLALLQASLQADTRGKATEVVAAQRNSTVARSEHERGGTPQMASERHRWSPTLPAAWLTATAAVVAVFIYCRHHRRLRRWHRARHLNRLHQQGRQWAAGIGFDGSNKTAANPTASLYV